MTVTLHLSDEVEKKLKAFARRTGTDVEAYLERLIEQTFREPLGEDHSRWIEETFHAIDQKYGEALKNLARK